MRRRRVLTDASVLSPRVARSILLRLADVGFFEIQWTSEIIQEMRQMILAKTPLLGRHSLNPLVHYMRVAYPNADVLDSDVLDTQEKLEVIPPQIKGYHIILAAVAGKVDSIVTVDRDRFATEICGDLVLWHVSSITYPRGVRCPRRTRFLPGQPSQPRWKPSSSMGSGVRTSAPRMVSRASSGSSVGTRRSRCIRFLPALGSGTRCKTRSGPGCAPGTSTTYGPLEGAGW